MQLQIGCSGWSYQDWKGRFYPNNISPKDWLAYYAKQFNSVELNYSFYRLPTEKAVLAWKNQVPAGFIFSVKVSRFITHMHRLKNCEGALETFISRMQLLDQHLGPLLYQLPPSFKCDNNRLSEFLSILPKNHCHVFEFRHTSWWTDSTYDLLRKHGAVFCVYDMGNTTTPIVTTAKDVYIRFHGPKSTYSSNYPTHLLTTWARKIKELKSAKRFWIYFNNDVKAYAINNASKLDNLIRSR